MRQIGVGFLGAGAVGTGALQLLRDHADFITARLNAQFQVKRIAVRDIGKTRPTAVDPDLLTADPFTVTRDPDIRIVVEVMGGTGLARELVLEALAHGKHVVTANKALLAHYGEEIFTAAERANCAMLFEAAVCAGVPIIRAIRDGLAADRVTALAGIVNGTSNYILTKMSESGQSFAEALAEAQQLGYAEADPALDVNGGDAAHKLAILATLAFCARVNVSEILTSSIAVLEPADLRWAERFRCVVKPLAIARDHGDAIELRVHPALVSRESPLAVVSDALNAVQVDSMALGRTFYSGRGAGSLSTGAGIVSDLIEAAHALIAFAIPRTSHARVSRPVLDMGKVRTRYYLRLTVADQPGVLGRVAGALGEHQVSIAEVVQGPVAANGPATLVILTHHAQESDVQAAREVIDRLELTVAPMQFIRMEG